MSYGVRVDNFKFIFSERQLEVAHEDQGIWSVCYRAPWRVLMWMPTKGLPKGFHEAYSRAREIMSARPDEMAK